MQKKPIADWQKALQNAFTELEQLCEYLEIAPSTLSQVITDRNFPLKVPRSFADRIEKGNSNDPILRQILPISAELADVPNYLHDPVGDLCSTPIPGILHKYSGRALLITTGGCAIHCRYCFRRNFPYMDLQLSSSRLQNALTYIKQHTDINEIILSGGDPLLLNDQRINELIQHLNSIDHIKRIRIHSRIPVVLPERITPELLTSLESSRQKVIMVIHANHANELSPQFAEMCQNIASSGILLLNQSVLLKEVNDNIDQLIALSEKLFQFGILPYYLHVLDKATGTAHFDVDRATAIKLHQQLLQALPGYLVPKLVEEQAGATSKIWINQNPLNRA